VPQPPPSTRRPAFDCRWLFVPMVLAVTSCGGGGGSSTPSPAPATPTLTSVALAPLALSLPAGATSQLTVTGTYSDGSTKALPASGEVFASSNTAAAAVSVTGVVTAAANAISGATVTITASDTASGLTTSTGNSAVVTIAPGSSGPPTANSAAATAQTAQSNALCTAIQPFYWEIGDATSALASGSSTQSGGTAVTAATKWTIASASKWIYGMYVVQNRGGAANLTAADIKFLNFTSGYTYMDTLTQSATCTAPASGADSINYCLTLPSSTAGKTYSSHNPSTDGVFDYDGGHEENHAGQFQPEINSLDTSQLGTAIVSGLNVSGIDLRYTQPLLAGGIYASANDYSPILRAVLKGQLGMLDALGTNAVCAWVGSGCNAAYSPATTVQWHYSVAHWVEDDPATGDGAFSSPGAFGFYPWIESNRRFYGVISRYAPANGEIQNGLASSQCGHALRTAWETGVQQ
jgi:Bacterial Ig-like domain (group 2)